MHLQAMNCLCATGVALIAIGLSGCGNEEQVDVWGNADLVAPGSPANSVGVFVVGRVPDDIRAVYVERRDGGTSRATASLTSRGLETGGVTSPLPPQPLLYANGANGIFQIPLPADAKSRAILRNDASPQYDDLVALWQRAIDGGVPAR